MAIVLLDEWHSGVNNWQNQRRVDTLPENIAYLFKLVFLGEGAVGKTSLVGRYVYDSFEGDYLATIGTDIHVKMIQIEDDVLVKLVVWDIAGQDDFAQLRKAYYQNTSGAFFVFDTTRPQTIERIDEWIDALYGVTGPIPLVLLENKVDLETAISKENIKAIVSKYKVDLIRTSAKEDTNVEEAFKKMTKEILKRARTQRRKPI
ncbi:MAG: GTP-binding protein [Candidatus Thorarchaeota archaeon]